ncbi:MAG: hypothetical protein HY815_26515 [Candidatus Riflebacteria bacterium]|nr:hypothetical protein [Candidatus Riflebacteria bacterium]
MSDSPRRPPPLAAAAPGASSEASSREPGPPLVTLIQLIGRLLGLMPPALLRWIGERLGDLAGLCFRRRREVARANLSRAFPQLPCTGIDEIVTAHFRHLGKSLVETLILPSLVDPGRMSRWVAFEGLERLDDELRAGRGAIHLTAHLGSWELSTVLAALGYPVLGLYKDRDYATVRILTALRSSTGAKMLSKESGVRDGLKALHRGHLLGILADQGPGDSFPFFGHLAPFPRGAGLAVRPGIRAFPVFAIRRVDGGVTVKVEPPLSIPGSGPRKERVRAAVAGFVRLLEERVRSSPEQYYWVHDIWRRFKDQELGLFVGRRAWGGRLWLRSGHENRIPQEGSSLEGAFARSPGTRRFRGRGICTSVPLGDDDRAVLRHYHHGGILAPVTRDLFWGPRPRPLIEMITSDRLRARGVPTPEVLGMFWRYRGFLFYQADIITREVPESVDLATFLELTLPIKDVAGQRRRRRRVLAEAGRVLARAHDAGMDHPDLNLKNLLVREGSDGLSVWILDLDRACLVDPLPEGRRQGQLARLERSLKKVARGRELVSDRERLAFLRGYFGSRFREAMKR